MSDTVEILRSVRDHLKQPIETLASLIPLLSQPLSLLGLLPPNLDVHLWIGSQDAVDREILLTRFMSSLQVVLLEHVVPVWWEALQQSGTAIDSGSAAQREDARARQLLRAWFSPAASLRDPTLTSQSKGKSRDYETSARRVAIAAYQSLVSQLTSTRTPPSPVASTSAAPPPPSLMSPSTLAFILDSLCSLSEHHSLPLIHDTIFSSSLTLPDGKRFVVWEALCRTLISIPVKVANATQGGTILQTPKNLEREPWFGQIALGVEQIVRNESQKGIDADVSPLRTIISHLASQSYLSPSWGSPSLPPSPPNTFFAVLLPILLQHLASSSPSSISPPIYGVLWHSLISNLPLAAVVRVADSLLQHLVIGVQASLSSPNSSEDQRACMVQRAGEVLGILIGQNKEAEPTMESVLIGWEGKAGNWDSTMLRARIGVCWVGGTGKDEAALQRMMLKALDLWSDPSYIKFSLATRQTYLTMFLHLLLLSFPAFSPSLLLFASSPKFLTSLTHYLGHPDKVVRGLGMMLAETVSERTIREDATGAGGGMKRLKFGIWEGEGEWRQVVRRLRTMQGDWLEGKFKDDSEEIQLLGWRLNGSRTGSNPLSPSSITGEPSPSAPSASAPSIKKAKKPKRIEPLSDSDDSLTGYQSSSSSSSSSSPKDLDVYLTDPTLYTPNKKLPPRPVYLAQLLAYITAREDPEKLNCGLKWGESLVRRKRSFGLELEENAVGIAVMLAGLDDGFELEDFENRKQGILNALVACAPKTVAPALIEQYFSSQYSLHQRSAILEALAMGARELASLSTLKAPTLPSIDWPSKKLPPALHDRYVSINDVVRTPFALEQSSGRQHQQRLPGRVEEAAKALTSEAIEKGREEAETKVGEIQREKQLRVRMKTTRPLAASSTTQNPSSASVPSGTAFKDVAAEYFILPLINRLWTHYLEQTTLRQRSSSHTSAGTGMILSPLSLSKFFATLSVLIHAARHSPLFLAVLAPQSIELAVKLGASPLASSTAPSLPEFSAEGEGEEVSVLTTSLELTLVSLDVSRDLDGGRTLMLNHIGLVSAAAEWGALVFGRTERGERVMGEGRSGGEDGLDEGVQGVRRASAGLCVVIGEMREKWGRLVGF